MTLRVDGKPAVQIEDVKDRGGGIYVVCFTLPAGYNDAILTVGGDRDGTSQSL